MPSLLLQAAMAFGLLLREIVIWLFLLGIPVLAIIIMLYYIRKYPSPNPPGKDLGKIALKSILQAILGIFLFTIALILFLLFTVDLSES
jgi:hypothetical protein